MPHIKLCDAGKMRHDIWDFVVCNVRTPDATRADMGAMFSALNTAEPRMTELCEKFGIETVRRCLRRIVERAEEMARDEIRAMRTGPMSAATPWRETRVDPATSPFAARCKSTATGWRWRLPARRRPEAF